MSRETDSSSSGPKGRGGSSYPPGTEPYGPGGGAGRGPADPGADPAAEGGAKPDEPKTETTLTTRIRINIPGSRPIPPVVMRTPVNEEDAPDDDESQSGPATSGSPAAPGAPGATSGRQGGPGSVASPFGSSAPSPGTGSGIGSASGAAPASAAASGAGPGPEQGQGGGPGDSPEQEEGFTQETSDWFSPRRSPKSTSPSTGGTGAGAGSTPAPGTPLPGSPGSSAADAQDPAETAAFPRIEDRAETPPDGLPLLDPSLGRGAPAPGAPTGPTTGPATGDMRVPPAPGAPNSPSTPGGPSGAGDPAANSTLGLGTGPAPFAPDGLGTAMYGDEASIPGSGAVPGEGLGVGLTPGAGTGPGTDPQAGGGRPDAAGGAEPGRAAGKTVVSGVPHGTPEVGPMVPPPAGSVPAAPPLATPAPAAAPRKKGRSKLVLAGVGIVGIACVTYGVGLLLDHADVPKGTTVLGVGIGGLSKHEAVNKLDDSLGGRPDKPLKVVAGGKQAEIKPSVAGLTLDTESTVRDAAGRDYNPVSVIGSLFGAERQAEPAIKVDAAKMKTELLSVTNSGGAVGPNPADGMVRFTGGKPVVVKGKPHKGIDTAKAAETIQEAYRRRAATGGNTPVELPVGTQQPKFSTQQLQAAADGFGRRAMSGWVWLRAGDVEVPFSQQTIGKFLTMQGGTGKLVPVIDPDKLQATYGNAFDGVVIDAGTGAVKMTPRHAANAMAQALEKKAPPKPQKRVAQVPGSRSQ